MHRSIATVSLSGTLRQKLEAIAAAGFDGIELFENDFINFNGSRRRAARDRRRPGPEHRPVPAVPRFRGHARGAVPAQPGACRAQVRPDAGAGCADWCCAARTPRRWSSTSPELRGRRNCTNWPSARRGATCASASRRWPGAATSTCYGQAWDIVRRADHPHLGLILDSFHTLSLKDDPAGIADIPGRQDLLPADGRRAAAGDGRAAVGAPLPLLPGPGPVRHGELPRAGAARRLHRAAVAGDLQRRVPRDARTAAPRSMRCARCSTSKARCATRLATPRRRPTSRRNVRCERVELFDPPPVPQLDGLLVHRVRRRRGIGRGARHACCEQLGFRARRAGIARRRSCCIAQGDIHLIVNAQPDSFARSRFEPHGTSVCALGLRTADPEARRRAAPPRCCRSATTARSARTSCSVPAIVAPGGNLVHFVSSGARRRTACTRPTSSSTTARRQRPAPACSASTTWRSGLPIDQLDTWVLFSRAVLGLEPGESLELADPFGLIRSRGVANADRSVRLVLNVSLSQRTRTARR